MRLTSFQQNAIRDAVRTFVPDAKVMLYGSRADDTKRGGDIDLLVLTSSQIDRSVRYKILGSLYRTIGEQKIDLLLEDPAKLSLFGQIVLPFAVPL
jgi:predicted nucleotidyltransferase